MNPHKQWPKEKSWQWRIIIIGSLLLIFGKDIGAKISQYLRFPEFSVIAATKIEPIHPLLSESAIVPKMTIEVTNDSNKDCMISDKIVTGSLNYANKQFLMGQVKKFVITSNDGTANAHGDIVFTSSFVENKEVPCQIIHVLNYDLNYVNQIPQPLKINLSSIASHLECVKKASAE